MKWKIFWTYDILFGKILELMGFLPSRPATWVATVPAKDCYHPSTGEGYCNFFFSFCKLLPHGQCFNSSFCQGGQNPVSFGVFNKNQKIFESKSNIHADTVNHSVVIVMNISHCSCQTIHMFL